ncbi:hypothetical protein Ancab_027422 [Ancistrocladus abbreviatus]
MSIETRQGNALNPPETSHPENHQVLQPFDMTALILYFHCDIPILASDIGIGMVLSSTPCQDILSHPETLASLAPPTNVATNFYPLQSQIIAFNQGGLEDENSVTFLVEDDPEAATSTFFVQQILDPPIGLAKSDLNSNDSMVKNLKHFDMENSNSNKPSINSTGLKKKKKGVEGRAHSKKNNTNKTSVPTHDDL